MRTLKINWLLKSLSVVVGVALPALAMAITNLSATSDATNVYYKYSFSGAPKFLRVFLDTDQKSSTGYSIQGIGAEYLIENGNLYKYSGPGGSTWAFTFVGSSKEVLTSPNVAWTIARSQLGNPAAINLVANVDNADYSAIVQQTLTSAVPITPPAPSSVTWTRCASENGTCLFSGTRQVRYGANGVFAYKTATASIGCNNSVFGDPLVGTVKGCDYSSAVTQTPVPAPVPPAATPTPTPVPAPVPPSTMNFIPPTLVNPVSPLQYGAKCDGVSDDSAAFQSAVNASDVLIPAGKTCVINTAVEVTMNNRHIECGAGATLKQTVSVGRMFNILSKTGGRLTGDSIVNCYFLGTNTVAPQADWINNGKHYNIPVQTQDRVDNFFLAGNTFDRFWGQSMFQTYGATDGGSGDKIIFNTFKSCGYYGPVLAAHKNGLIANNKMVDCATGVENDNMTQVNGGNIIENNTLTCVYGYGGADMGACAMLTGGVAAGADNRTNIVRNNTVSGSSSSAGFQGARGSRVIIGLSWGVLAAQYSNNSCTNGCVVTP